MIIIIEQEGLTKEPTLPEKVGRWKYKWGDINICEVLGYMNSPQLQKKGIDGPGEGPGTTQSEPSGG